MLAAALRDGTAHRRTAFRIVRPPAAPRDVVTAWSPELAGCWKPLPQFRFDDEACRLLGQFLDPDTLGYLRDFRFSGESTATPRVNCISPGPHSVGARQLRRCVMIERWRCRFSTTTLRSLPRRPGWCDAGERPLIDMGSRRTHERAAVAAARAAYVAGFAATSNLEAQRRYGIPPRAPPRTPSPCCTRERAAPLK